MKRIIVAAALALAAAGGTVGVSAQDVSALACTHTAAYGNVNIRATKSTSAAIVGTLVGGQSISGDCGATAGGSYSCWGMSGQNWYRVYGSTFTGSVASACVVTS